MTEKQPNAKLIQDETEIEEKLTDSIMQLIGPHVLHALRNGMGPEAALAYALDQEIARLQVKEPKVAFVLQKMRNEIPRAAAMKQ